ncbi:MAG: hypothetical protein A2Z96_01010 [Spirochaetes bacterium GWB1_48_6]|nr:MAG: hypothetical protein A2Z96_01010 [Spirochaetes bacterium GWB1_48_6]
MEIQKAEWKDLPGILDLQKRAFSETAQRYGDPLIAPLTQTLEGIREEFHDSVFLKFETEGRLMGAVRGKIEDQTAFIHRLVVHPGFQDQGWGQKLLNAMEKELSSAERLVLYTGHKDIKSLHIYEKHGYQAFKEERVNPRLILIHMEKYRN